jgi:hypothetical protein
LVGFFDAPGWLDGLFPGLPLDLLPFPSFVVG